MTPNGPFAPLLGQLAHRPPPSRPTLSPGGCSLSALSPPRRHGDRSGVSPKPPTRSPTSTDRWKISSCHRGEGGGRSGLLRRTGLGSSDVPVWAPQTYRSGLLRRTGLGSSDVPVVPAEHTRCVPCIEEPYCGLGRFCFPLHFLNAVRSVHFVQHASEHIEVLGQ